MVDPIDIVSKSLSEDRRLVEIVSNNIANVNSAGFKSVSANKFHGGMANQINLDSGKLVKTGRGLDLAIQGQGFFLINSGNEQLLTRNGSFQVNQDGYLVAGDGTSLVQGVSSGIYVGDESFVVDQEGRVISEGKEIDKLAIFSPVGDVQPAGQGMYRAEMTEIAEKSYQISQGSLEASNVDIASEMVQLITAQKHFGLMQRYFITYDSMLKSGINKLGNSN
ncbi:flagellar hook basal-body protein [Vibrio vulnificus]|nr:flagellar hook basal-body protein [Vibrio vulnificus]EIZ1408482.1 flagellar hook basal-body protein [Vibrio vulnificus]EJA3293427.1 flagellar hook basal-body protein [Vibrio vulnificus]EJA3297121.1 flagellar hook basal-body protein [Vibrio vulnificus]MCU8163200.1 flagellar hook basal-body protein [Vibrio vulnificus]